MLGEMRQRKLKEILLREGSVRIADLKSRFGVSEETVRRDLRKLESEGLARRTHGGAMLAEPVHVVPPAQQRMHQNVAEKAAVAERAVDFIRDGNTVMLDSGTTTLEIARRLAARPVTVVTNDLVIAAELATSVHVQLVVLGGTHQRGTPCVVGPECVEMIGRYHVDVVFLGAGGVSVNQGLTTASSAERQVKRAMMLAGDAVYCVVDGSKLGRAALVSYARVDEVDGIVLNASVPNEAVEPLRRQGAQVILAEVVATEKGG
ncbi:DeoR/GlpR family DNA-binding transcription regulator [Alicyclobacillus kakegawensis]|uniref:DeoR/GlpR family DNA-binding transcription regulator n=1 Tax=Alicyclobacillus kakegawensis TaxID=392012 RepID=UPI0008307B19|nr:DeoR/GlpR family DNA-binding transcription regulator [Alicyclobacillus kakegawensis]